MSVRVRFAPSPTGPLHIGGVRTALYNYLFAKKNGGKFILRIEDTDQTRFVPGAEKYIKESLEWCGLQFDEGPDQGGEFGPYRQSERKDIYRQYADQLIEEGKAYYAFDTPDELDAMRERLTAKGVATPQYDQKSRGEMKNSLTLSTEEVKGLIEQGVPYVIRIKIPENEEILVNDIIRGEVKVDSSRLDDKVLFKSDGMPTYHLANIADDHLMQISHVIRGEEWLPSAPLHVLLYRYLGWKAPVFAHLPLILKPKGNGKLSKRDGDKMGFPVFPAEWTSAEGDKSMGYREEGFLPEAFINFLALLGWNPGTEQEMFTLKELCQTFSLERVGKSGARFDFDKVKWFNQQYVRLLSDEELGESLQKQAKAQGCDKPLEYCTKVAALVKERAVFEKDLWDQSSYFFKAPTEYDAKLVKKRWKEETAMLMSELRTLLTIVEPFEKDPLHEMIQGFVEGRGVGFGVIMNPLRLLLVGSGQGADLLTMAEILGKEEVLSRMEKGTEAVESLKNQQQ